MRLQQNLDKSKKYYELSFKCKCRISSAAIQELRQPSKDINSVVINELVELGAVKLYKSADHPEQSAVMTLTPFGEILAESARRYKGITDND